MTDTSGTAASAPPETGARIADFLELVDRCDRRKHVYRNPRTLQRFRADLAHEGRESEYASILPGKQSIVYCVDQVLREARLEALSIDVWLRRFDKTKGSFDRMDTFEARAPWDSVSVSVLTFPPQMEDKASGHGRLGSEVITDEFVACVPSTVFIEVRLQLAEGDQAYYDRLPDSRQRELATAVNRAVSGNVAELHLQLAVIVHIWNSGRQAWD